MNEKPPVLHYAARGARPEGPRVSLFAAAALIVSIVSCPCVIASAIDWIDALLLRAGIAVNGVTKGVNVAIVVAAALTSVMMRCLAWQRISRRREELRGETLAALGLCLGFLWLMLASVPLLFWLLL